MRAGRRMGRRPLVRAAATTAVVAGTAAAVGGAVHHHQDQKYAQQGMGSAPPQDYYPEQTEPQYAPQEYESLPPAAPSAGSELMAQLQQLSSLHAAGVLTDDEFAAAKQKLLSS